jgi:ATP-dependent exoDNAse (exonuclease V) beta subunit
VNGAGITVIGASAGSGKTHRLTHEVTSAVSAKGARRVDLEGLVAVTFTRKAHAELEARIRHKLVEDEAYDEALRLPLAYVGTVHAASLRLLQEFAIDAGLSPSVDVVSGDETKLLRQAFESSLGPETREQLDELAARLQLGIDSRARRMDWVTPVADIMDLARSNRIAPRALSAMAERSIEGLLALLRPPTNDALDAMLADAIAGAIATLSEANDGKKNTAEALDLLRTSERRLSDGELRWSDWAKLAAISPSKACSRYVESVRTVAARHDEHPRLHEDLRATTRAVFDAARAGLVAYQRWKRERRVVDYVDMLDGALAVVDHPRVHGQLAQRLRLVVVDEFQDTSPIQLALFVRLHAIAGRSVWVGDRKQCIFEYAGADPVLMDAVAAWVEEAGGTRERLGHNYRSRYELVDLCSEIFSEALGRHGFTREEVVVAARRTEPLEVPPLGFWALDVKSKDDDAEAIAAGVRRLLDAPNETKVLDRTTGAMRDLRAGDIAILVTTNAWASRVAEALYARGLRVALARSGLFDTPEGTLVDAALRWLVDPNDGLSAAVIDGLTGWGGRDPDSWLEERLREVASREARGVRGYREGLDALRPRLAVLSPAEVLDGVLAALDATYLCARWPDPTQRIANVDALRAAAANYEARCGQEREAATIAGMLRYFDALRSPTLQRDEVLPSDDQHVAADDDAVVVCTYHKSKGLEWPVVVLTNLDRGERRDAFEVSSESLVEGFDPEEPLANRSIRYWPWPFGAMRSGKLADAAEASAEGRAVALREEKERARLLYVGFTRARDHLVLAARVGKGRAKTPWLDALRATDGSLIMELPVPAEGREDDGAVVETRLRLSREVAVATRVFRLDASRGEREVEREDARWFSAAARGGGDVRPAYRITPSMGADDWPELAARVARARIGRVERLGCAVEVEGVPYAFDVLGNAVHAFLAADVAGLAEGLRLERAKALVEGAGLAGVVRVESLLRESDALRAWVERRWPEAVWHREIPIEGVVASEHGERRVVGIVDLLIETEDGFVLIDHKSFPARSEAAWRAKCGEFVPQLAAYAAVLEGVKAVREVWVHLPVGGGMVEIGLSGPHTITALSALSRAQRGNEA